MQIAVIGGGPAGMRAAEVASRLGVAVTLFDAKPSPGRKFLVAGRGGLNLTHAEPIDRFLSRYALPDGCRPQWESMIRAFDPDALRQWALDLGVETFAAGTGRVYPLSMKAAPLLRNWMARLRAAKVQFAFRHRWSGLQPGDQLGLRFQTPTGEETFKADAAILALGGGSWPETGSNGSWTSLMESLGIRVLPLEPANCGWEIGWPPGLLAVAEGEPLKNIRLSVADVSIRGELMVTAYGLEGGAIYQAGRFLRAMANPEARIDFKPDSTVEQLRAKLSDSRGALRTKARKILRLTPAAMAVLEHGAPDCFDSEDNFLRSVKDCPVRLKQPRPIAEAISSGGGVCWSELNEELMVRRVPGLFVAGEMIDWEAPTGGYLMQGCFATGTHAGTAAARWVASRNRA